MWYLWLVVSGTLGTRLRSLGDWFTLRSTLGSARAQLPSGDQLAGRAFDQARLLREVASQVANPPDELPPGRRPAVLLSLYRDAIYWTLAADLADAPHELPQAPPEQLPELEALWQRSPAERLLRAARTEEALAAIRRAVVDVPGHPPLDISDAEAARVRDFADRLYTELEAPRRQVHRIVARRWLHWATVVAVALAIALVARAVAVGPDLAKGKPFRTSSTQPGCAENEHCAALMFHTTQEDNPWVEIDLGAVKPVHLIEVSNRPDCCQDRAIPLVAEVSKDRAKWTEMGRRDEDFTTWTLEAKPTPARYVRLRAPRATTLHLQEVVVR